MPRPIRTAYTIPYGAQFGAPRAGGTRRHQGTDYHCPIGTPIYGTGDSGRVVAKGYQPDPNNGAGNYVTITYPGNRRTTDMHMREASPLPIGARVNAQTVVGYVGLTGNAVNASPPGSHDHHQITVNGILVNPETFYGTEPASSGGTPIVPENHLPEYGGANVALVMNRTQDNVIAIYDESHWQEFTYTSNMQPTATVKQYQIDFAVGQSHALPNVPYDSYAWDLRSNKNPALKRPLFVDNGSSITPIVNSELGSIDVEALATALAPKLGVGITKQDLIDALKSVSYKAG